MYLIILLYKEKYTFKLAYKFYLLNTYLYICIKQSKKLANYYITLQLLFL